MKSFFSYSRLLSFIVLILSALFSSSALAQDQIYLLDGKRHTGNVKRIGKKIAYESLADQKEYIVSSKEVAWILEPNGIIRVFKDGENKVIHFDHEHYDKMLFRTGVIEPVDLRTFDESNVSFVNLREQEMGVIALPKTELFAIILRGKQILPYASNDVIAKALWEAEQPKDVPPLRSQQEENPEPTLEQELPIDNVGSTSTQTMEPPEAQVAAANQPPKEEKPDSGMPVSEEEFIQKAMEKTRRLTQYILVITDKTSDKYEASKAMNEALILFMSDTCIVQVSNINHPEQVREYFIRPYLNHIKLLKYDKVAIEWAEINYVGDVRKGPDGNYYGYVTFVQTFRGFKDGNVVYEDKTEKRIEVVLKTYEFEVEGTTKELWDVLLSNIKVEHTSRI